MSDPARPVRRILDPVQRFLHTESAGGLMLAAAALIALVWANVDGGGYDRFWHTELAFRVGDLHGSMALGKFAKDGLMAVFFLVVGLEIKRELTVGELADRRLARVPFLAALGGMALPAALYALVNAGGAVHGWGIPMATDIAFAVGVLSLLARRIPSRLGAFLLAVAVIDDIGAILVIAVFYSGGIGWGHLALAAGALALVAVLLHWRVRLVVPYVVLGVAAWLAMTRSGVSPTLTGVALGLLIPVRPWAAHDASAAEARGVAGDLEGVAADDPAALAGWRRMDDLGRQAVPLDQRLVAVLHPWSAFVVLPVFALAYAGVPLSLGVVRDSLSSAITLGVVVGLVVGKTVGVTLGTWLAVRLGLGRLPEGVGWSHVVGVAGLAGIGFTVSMFVATLAFDDASSVDAARVGIIGASLLAGILGTAALLAAGRRST